MTDILLLAEPFFIVISTITLSFISGWGVACRLNLEPLERLAVSVLAGFTLIYFFEFGAYLLSLPSRIPFLLLILTSLLTTLTFYFQSKPKIVPSIRLPWAGIIAWLVISLWGMAIQFQVVVYGTQMGWAGDWLEHYERALFFLKQLPPETLFLNNLWTLPARGPLFNSVAGLLMGGLGESFWVYQILATVLNSFCVLPMALLLKKISKLNTAWSLIISVGVFALAPFALQQIIYTWTKMFSAGFILTGIYFYIVGLEKGKDSFFAGSFLFFSLGILAHYMTILFVIFFIIHYIFLQFKQQRLLRGLTPPLLISFFVLSTWFFYLFATFGIKETLFANNTLGNTYTNLVNKNSEPQLDHYQIVWANTVSTFIPFSFRHDWLGYGPAPDLIKRGWSYQAKDLTSEERMLNARIAWKLDLINDQSSFTGNIGYTAAFMGLMALLYLMMSKDYHLKTVQPGWKFWSVFFILGIYLHLWAYRHYAVQGVSYSSFQPYLCLLVIFMINGLRILPKKIQIVLAGLYFLESAFKSWIWIQMHQRPVLLEKILPSGFVIRGPELNQQYVMNYLGKIREGPVFLSDRFGEFSDFLSLMSIGIILVILSSFLAIWVFNFKRKNNNVVR